MSGRGRTVGDRGRRRMRGARTKKLSHSANECSTTQGEKQRRRGSCDSYRARELAKSSLHLSAKDSLFSLVKGCTDAIHPLRSEANNVQVCSGTANESQCFLTESVFVDCESHQPMKLTDVRYNKLLLFCNKEVLM